MRGMGNWKDDGGGGTGQCLLRPVRRLHGAPNRCGFLTDETNARQSANMERECDPDISSPGCRERGKENPCGAERKLPASMFSRSLRSIISYAGRGLLRTVKRRPFGRAAGDCRPCPWRGKMIFASSAGWRAERAKPSGEALAQSFVAPRSLSTVQA